MMIQIQRNSAEFLGCCWAVQPHRRQPTRLPRPWDSPGKNITVGCHFLLQGIFPTKGSNPCLQHWQAKDAGVGCHSLLQGIFPTQGWNPHWHWQALQLCLTLCDPIDSSLLGSTVPGILQARILEWVTISSSRGSS